MTKRQAPLPRSSALNLNAKAQNILLLLPCAENGVCQPWNTQFSHTHAQCVTEFGSSEWLCSSWKTINRGWLWKIRGESKKVKLQKLYFFVIQYATTFVTKKINNPATAHLSQWKSLEGRRSRRIWIVCSEKKVCLDCVFVYFIIFNFRVTLACYWSLKLC